MGRGRHPDPQSDRAERQIGAIYRLTGSCSVFGSAAKVRRVPVADGLYAGFSGAAASPDLRVTRGRNPEVGLGYRSTVLMVAGDEAALKVTLFRNHIRDINSAPLAAYEFIDRARLRGGKIEACAASGGWQRGASVSVHEGWDQDGAKLVTLQNSRVMVRARYRMSE